MKTFLAGADVTVDVLFEQGTDTVVPDLNSVFYTLYANDGTAIASNIAMVTTGDTTSVAIPVIAANNAITGDFESRTVAVTFKVNGGTRQIITQYRLVSFVPITVTPDDVRALIGVSRSELPDSDIDIPSAYFDVRDDIGATPVADALIAKDKTTRALNRAIVCQALLTLMPSIQLRVRQEIKSNTAQISRFTKIDFAALLGWLTDLYRDASEVILPVDRTAFGLGSLMVVTTPTNDPVTGTTPATQ